MPAATATVSLNLAVQPMVWCC